MKQKILEIIADYKGVSPEELDTAASWASLKFDSLDITEVCVRLEDELNVEIEISPEITNIDDLIKYIEAKA